MNSRIEQIIDEMEEYIEGCKPKLFRGSDIIVDKETMDELLAELRANTPDEIKRYQKIISNQEAILANARTKAEEIVAQAEIQTNELVSEHEIMQQAYSQANEVVMIATKQAQEILDNATNDANAIRTSAISYTDEKLRILEEILSNSIETSRVRTENLVSSLQGYLDVVTQNRAELMPQDFSGVKPQEVSEAHGMNPAYPASEDAQEP